MRSLLTVFDSPGDVLRAPVQRLSRVPGIDKSTAAKIREFVPQNTHISRLNYLEQQKIHFLTYWDKDYPQRLRTIYDPPLLLFYKGNLSVFDEKGIGVVGMRNPSLYGITITERLCRDLTRNGLVIISGLARGIDTVAHQAAVSNGGRTIAVLGSGMDQIYPKENLPLARKIEENGVVISEYPPGTKPDMGNFPRRNRIISGLSIGILVTEAAQKSGALITAYQALEQNREVFAVPGPVNSLKSSGPHRLIREGAHLVENVSDILEELEWQGSKSIVNPVDHGSSLEGLERIVYDKLSERPVHIDILTRECERTVSEVLSALLTLELHGIAKQLSGKMFVRTYI
ncbi:MAG: DNA-protecting protein DprA [Calditrichales bacterium]|nr:MAG: DNA-protecting protein DprA [Calditrichales bacterium]